METIELNGNLIIKEVIPQLKLAHDDVLTYKIKKVKRWNDLKGATILGNGYHEKVFILFQTADGEIKRVENTIWDYDENFVIFKSGTSIPINFILNIDHI